MFLLAGPKARAGQFKLATGPPAASKNCLKISGVVSGKNHSAGTQKQKIKAFQFSKRGVSLVRFVFLNSPMGSLLGVKSGKAQMPNKVCQNELVCSLETSRGICCLSFQE